MTRLPDYSRAATMAYRCLLALHVTELPVRPLDMLRRCRGTVVMTYARAAELLAASGKPPDSRLDGADAFTVRYGMADGSVRYLVCYRAGGNRARLNFTLAHELGHIVLRHSEDQAADDAEANCFATHLLCPRPVIRTLWDGLTPLYAEHIATVCFMSVAACQAIGRCRPCRIDPALESLVAAQLRGALNRAAASRRPVAYGHRVCPARYVGR